MKERKIGIDILKFLAVFFILNSHMGILYVKFPMLASGGAIGNALFFFCSGFTLFLKPFGGARDFPNWYKVRINRIYPTVFAVAIVLCTFFDYRPDINYIILYGGLWFVTCIMVYYVIIYFIGVYFHDRLTWVLVAAALAFCILYYCLKVPFPYSLYADDVMELKRYLYFIFMLFGARMGLMDTSRQSRRQWLNLLLALLSAVVFYVLCGVTIKDEKFAFLHVFTFVALMAVLYFLYLWADGDFARKIYQSRVGYFIIRFVGGLCLEIYVIQNWLITDRMNALFPLNIPIMFLIVILAAYLIRCFARFLSQTFKDAPYDWKKMVSAY
jgi:peptidoglycan/LPS O-acetylase OafA/YrhL